MPVVLDNGLNVLLQENHSAPVVAIQMWVNAGSADDPVDLSGLAHVLEHMMFKGTPSRSEGQIAMEIEGSGGHINAWTSFDNTVFHVVIASRYFEQGLGILADALQNARLSEQELKREIQVILEEIKQGEDTPSRVVSRSLFAAAYGKHPYGRPVIGRAETVGSMRRAQIERFYRLWYRPSNMTLVVVGDFSSQKAISRIRALFSRGSRKMKRPGRPEEPGQRRMRVSVAHRDINESYIAMAFHIPPLTNEETPALDLAAVILGQGESCRLSRNVKHDRQLVTTAYAYAYTPRDPGLLVVGGTTTPARMLKATQAMVAEALALGHTEVTPDELRRAKTLIESEAVYQKETVQGQARKLGFFQSVARSVAFEQEYYRRIEEVTPTQLRRVAARYLKVDNLTVSVAGPGLRGRRRQAVKDLKDAVRVASSRLLDAGKARVDKGSRVLKATLPNGARLLVLQDRSVPLVAMRAVWMGGLRHENAANNGINSLLAALITRGTTSRSADKINETIESMAGSIGGFSGQNSFGIRAELLSRHWEQGLEVLADCLLNPLFEPREVEHQRQLLLDDILAQEDNLSSVVMRLFSRTMYMSHPYSMDVLGTVESVSALTRDQLIRYYSDYFPPSGVVLSVVGDVEPDQVRATFARLFGKTPRDAKKQVHVTKEPAPRSAREAHHFVNKQQAHLVVGYPGVTLRSKDRFALEVMVSVLSGQGGRLFLELRDRLGLAYQVGAYSQEGLEPGYIAVYIATSPNKTQQALEGIDRQLQRMKDELIRPQDLARIKRYLVGTFEISLQRRSSLASYLAFNECYGMGYRAYTRYAPSILAVTAEDVRRVAREYLRDQRRVVAVVEPEQRSPGADQQMGEGRGAGRVRPSQPKANKRR